MIVECETVTLLFTGLCVTHEREECSCGSSEVCVSPLSLSPPSPPSLPPVSLLSGVGGEVVGSGSESDLEDEEEGGGDQPLSISQQLKGGIIPNAEFIHRVRREREERRQMGGGNASAPSVMPLSTSKKVPMAKGKSRLVREDDNDRSDDSDGEQGGRRRMDAGNQDDAAIKQFQVYISTFVMLRSNYMLCIYTCF